jgi:putative redox protein
MITVVGVMAAKKEIALGAIHADIEKIMEANPRRVGEIKIHLRIEDKNFGFRERRLIEEAALSCPVAKSLSQELKQTITFEYIK